MTIPVSTPVTAKATKTVAAAAPVNTYILSLSDFLAMIGCSPAEVFQSMEVRGTPGNEQVVVETTGE